MTLGAIFAMPGDVRERLTNHDALLFDLLAQVDGFGRLRVLNMSLKN